MKQNKSMMVPFLYPVLFLLVCMMISLLYTFDIFTTHLYEASCLLAGCMLYLFIGILLTQLIKKRQLVIALFISIVLMIFQILNLSFSKELLQYMLKLLFFTGTVFIIQFKHQP